MEWFVVIAASGLAGFVDAIVGGGGLIMVPALFATFPGAHPATLFGVNKSASVWGTAAATWQYTRRVQLPWRALLPASGLAFAGAMLGAWAVTQVSPHLFRLALPGVLLLLLLYTLAKKDLGRLHAPRFSQVAEVWAMGLLAGVVGLYDGFFGPGTGSFLVFFFGALDGLRLFARQCQRQMAQCHHQFGGSVVVCLDRARLVALRLGDGRGQCGRQLARYTFGAETGCRVCAHHVLVGGFGADTQNRLGRSSAVVTPVCSGRHRHVQYFACLANGGCR